MRSRPADGTELKFLGDELEQAARPFVVILGGEVSDKIQVIDRLLEKADSILMAARWPTLSDWRKATRPANHWWRPIKRNCQSGSGESSRARR
jgi:hypothetical protein